MSRLESGGTGSPRDLPSGDHALWAITQSALHLPAVIAATRLGLFDALADARSTAERLARRLRTTPRATRLLLQFLASLGLVELSQRGARLTDVGRTYCLKTSPLYWGALFERLATLPLTADAIELACRNGKPSVYQGDDIWRHHANRAERARAFAEGAHCRALATALELAQHPSFLGFDTLLDVGSGKATYAVAFATFNPSLQVHTLDLEPVCGFAREHAKSSNVEGRITVHAGDMFRDAWPAPVDAVFLSDILHDWPLSKCAALARRAFACLKPGGTILINEVLLDERGTGPLPATSYGLAMLFSTAGGRQYRLSEVRGLLKRAGFVDARVLTRTSVHTLVGATKRGTSSAETHVRRQRGERSLCRGSAKGA
jgi:hypothetical protein